MNHYLITYLFVHFVCAVLSYGVLLAYFQREWPNLAAQNLRADIVWSIGISLYGGPITLGVALFSTGFAKHGLLFWPERDERP